jgi:hypothetical protein
VLLPLQRDEVSHFGSRLPWYVSHLFLGAVAIHRSSSARAFLADGLSHVRERTKRAFFKNKHETDPEKIMNGIKRAQFVLKEMEALIQLKKYRAMKRRYIDNKDRNPLDLKTFEDSIVDL